MIVLMNYAFAELISNQRTISSSNTHYIYPKDKPLWRKSVKLRFQFLIKMKSDKPSDVKNVYILSVKTEYSLSTERFDATL